MNPNKPTARYLRRIFPNAPESFIQANCDHSTDTGKASGGKQTEERISETCRDGKVEAQYRLRHIEIEFFASHGKQLDEDNRRYAAKPICDALVNLGFDRDDKDITTSTTQRMDKAHPIF